MSTSPIPATPSPLTIGKSFLKQYYHVLTTTPDMIYKFYRPSSVLSHGEGSNPTTPVTMESLGMTPALKDRFFSSTDDPVRFELEHGAIDAQESVGGGVLLVVTGHMYLGDVRKPFCHTFFLHASETSKKRQYYVHNDVLRFLQDQAPLKESALTAVVEEEEESPVAAAPAVVAAAKEEEQAASVVVEEPKEGVKEEPPLVVAAEPEAAPEGYQEGVEESKEEFADEEETAAPAKETAKAPTAAAPKLTPGSWASLVASSAPVAASPQPNAAAAPATKKQSNSTTAKTAESTTKAAGSTKGEVTPISSKPAAPNNNKKEKKDSDNNKSDKPQRGRRDPDCTLVIKHVPDGTKEEHVRLIFEPFAIQTQTKIVGITVSQRGLAFVDYDSSAPVLMALEKKEKFSLNGKTVDIDQKTNDNKNRGRGGGNNNSNNNRSNGQQRSGGGRSNSDNQRQRNNNNGRGGGRSGKGGGNSGSGGGGGR